MDWWGSFFFPLLTVVPAVVVVWYGDQLGLLENFVKAVGIRNYIGYLLIGVVYWNYVEILWSTIFILRYQMRTGQFEDVFLSPITGLEYILGWAMLGVVRVTMESIPLLLLALLFNIFQMTILGVLWALFVFFLSIIASFGLTFAIFGLTLVFKEGDELASLVGNAAPFLGGLFFPVTILPPFLQWFSLVLPFTWGIDLIRHLLLGSRTILTFAQGVTILFILAMAFLLLGVLVYQRLMLVARMRGVQGF
ncbi:MAG: hypothetical protein DDT23_01108 [candidate division WS2 bacterium]|nr:hypothetical protein [Candidatus Lithacetigena glycinireducens]